MTKKYDIAIIGGGHNGLVCAAYLARAGKKVVVLERRAMLGGAAVTEEFQPGFRNSTCSYTVSLLHPQVMRDLDLAGHGLRIVKRKVNNVFPDGRGGGLVFPTGTGAKIASFESLSTADAKALARFEEDLEMAADALRRLLLQPPPNAGGSLKDLMRAIRLGFDLISLPTRDQRLLTALATQSAVSFLRRYFENDKIIAAYAFDGIVGNYASPHDAGTAYVLLHHCFGEATGEKGVWGHAIGGMGAISSAIASAARSAGADLQTQAPVQQILLEGQRVTGLVLENGDRLTAPIIAANVTPAILFGQLLPDGALDSGTRADFEGIHYGSATFRMNVALKGLPEIPGFEDQPDVLTGGIVIGPTTDYLDQAYLSARQSGLSRRPVIEMLIPSTLDDSLAPPGQHVASLFCQHFDYEVFRRDQGVKDLAIATIFETIDAFLPGFSSLVLGYSALSPVDLENDFGLTRGDIFHGALSLGQLFSARPVLGHARYRMPLEGLYICGSGAHPGGGVTGLPGRNCAMEILKRF